MVRLLRLEFAGELWGQVFHCTLGRIKVLGLMAAPLRLKAISAKFHTVGCADDRKHNLRRRLVVPRTARHNLLDWLR